MTSVDRTRSDSEIVNATLRDTITQALQDNVYVWEDEGIPQPIVFIFTRNSEDTQDTDAPVVSITKTSVAVDTTDISTTPLYRTDVEITLNIDYGVDPDNDELTGQAILDRYAGRLLRSLRTAKWSKGSVPLYLITSYISPSEYNQSNRVRYNTTIILNIRYYSSEG